VVGGCALLGLSAASYASGVTGTMTVSPSTGLTNGATVTITGSGYADNSTGEILECNGASNEPYVSNSTTGQVSVGCTAPSLTTGLTHTSSTGTLSDTYTIKEGTVGPPCGQSGDIIGTCPSTDSAGLNPTTDAANYPCPPTSAQQAQGVTCSLTFGDQAGDSGTATILFAGETTGTTTTTAAPATSTTLATSTTATTTPSQTSLPTTGPGPGLWWMGLLGVILICLAALVLLLGRRAWRS